MLEIRPFQQSDLDFVVQIEQRVFSIPWSAQAFLDCARWPEFWFYVGVWERRVVAYFVAQVVVKEAELHNIAVDPIFQNKGIGKKMLQHFLGQAKKAKVEDVFLMVRPSNLPAIKLYQHFAFCLLDRRPRYYEDTQEDGLIFCRKI